MTQIISDISILDNLLALNLESVSGQLGKK